MPTIRLDAIDLYYETHGDPAAPPLLLINGLNSQLVRWPQGWVDTLVDRGLYVIRFDNRDVGLSSETPGSPPDPATVVAAIVAGDPPPVPYTLSDMAADAVGLLDHLGLDRAHVLGMSMGGMIAQTIAVEHPDRLVSLISLMSHTGDRRVGRPGPGVMEAMMVATPPDRDQAIAHDARTTELWSGPHYDFDHLVELNREAFDRSVRPRAMAFQVAAVIAGGDRTEALGAVAVPTLVIHGRADSLVDLSGGEATAEAIPGAELLIVDDLGHDLFPPSWPSLADAVEAHVRRAEQQGGQSR